VPRRGTMRPNIVGRHSHLRNNPTRIDHLLEDEKDDLDEEDENMSLVKRQDIDSEDLNKEESICMSALE